MIRAYHPNDLINLAEIHEKFYKEEFSLPNFMDEFLMAFTAIENENIVAVGGVKNILEIVLLTDKNKLIADKRKALYDIFQASLFTAGKYGYKEICAHIVNDDKWKRHLHKIGFRPLRGEMLTLDL